jgi:acyl CoA:acetate/3-ketoacid CoA transferase beta subunit
MVFCIARQIKDGETVVQGLATPLIAAGYLLARRTHAPHLYFASAIGQSICRQPAPLGLTRVEKLWLDCSLNNIGFVSVAADVLPSLKPKEFFRPAQVDPVGNFNNVAFGKNYLKNEGQYPRLRLPGTGGIPDVTTFISDIYLYVPRHSRLTFVEEVDIRSGLGHVPERTQGLGARCLISDMGQFDFANGRLRLTSHHPGTTIDRIQARTGFDLDIAQDVHETTPPTDEELMLLREEIDPLGIRRLELLSGTGRRQLLRKIIKVESGSE